MVGDFTEAVFPMQDWCPCEHERQRQHTQDSQVPDRQGLRTDGGRWTQRPALLKKLFVIDTCCKREISFLQRKVTSDINHKPRQALYLGGVLCQHKTNFMAFSGLFVLAFVALLGLFVLF